MNICSNFCFIMVGSTSMFAQYLMPMTPWLTSIPRPSRVVQFLAFASLMRFVCGGFGMTSATSVLDVNVSRLMFSFALTSGYRPMDVALMRMFVFLGMSYVSSQGVKFTVAGVLLFRCCAS